MTQRHVVVDHVLFIVSDLDRSRRLYTAALAPLQIEELKVEPAGVGYGREGLDDFAIYAGDPPTTGSHVAFDAADPEQVVGFFKAAIANGARVRGEPGVYVHYSDRYFAAFVDDLHGNNVEAVFHSPEPITDGPIRPGVP